MKTTPPIRKKLIEVALPLEAINKASAHEKQPGIGAHPRGLHLWWARRPLATCRAVLFGQLVDDPSAWPDKFKGEEAQEVERQRLFRIIEQLVLWENSTNEDVLNSARWEIARSVAWGRGEKPPKKGDGKAILAYLQEKAPSVYDPFCGGGSIPLEAQRLGLRAYGSDLNPVAVLISKALVEIPPKFAAMPPVNPDARQKLTSGASWNGKGAQGLADDLRYYGQWMREAAEKRIGHFYPRVEVTVEAVRQQPNLAPLQGQQLPVIAWLWARTVTSPNPAAKGAQVPLVSSYMLSSKDGKKHWVDPVKDAVATFGYHFEVRSGPLSQIEEDKAKAGTKAGKAQDFVCLLTDTPITRTYIQAEGKADRLGTRLMAIVAEGKRGRVYLPATDEHELVAARFDQDPLVTESRATFLSGSTPTRAMITGGVCSAYGLRTWGHLFTSRQLIGLATFSDLVNEVREKVLSDASTAGLSSSGRLADGGSGLEAYSDAVATFMAFAIDRLADYNSSIATWKPSGEQVMQTYKRQALPMTWDFPESNIFGRSAICWDKAIKYTANNLETVGQSYVRSGTIDQRDAAIKFQASDLVISTDPPYYDNIGYADLSDFFYIWLRHSLKSLWPALFATLLAPKAEELVATQYRHGSKEGAEKFFERGMASALKNMEQATTETVPIAIYYAFKQSEAAKDGISSTGWATFLQGVFDSGLMIDGTWPMRSELSNRIVASGTNALASSIVLVCRRRPLSAPMTTRAAFLAALKKELPAALKLLQAGNIAPVDLAQASIGPGMGIFTRHTKVLEADDSAMSVKTALQLINHALDDFLSEQEAEYDPETRFAITWFDTHCMAQAAYGEAETLASARNVSVAGVEEAGLVESKAGKVRLLPRSDLPVDWDPLTDTRLTVWECAQHLIQRLEADGEKSAAILLAKLGSRADATRDLAYRLYGICERKKWTEEARAYNGLVVAWPELVKLTAQASSRAPEEPAQRTLI